MRRLLVTGLSGFVGPHVRAALGSGVGSGWTLHAPEATYDLRLTASLDALLSTGPPDAVLHLAAQSFVPAAFSDPRSTFEINFGGTLNLLEALKRAGFRGRFVYVSSGDVYGLVPETELPVSESRPPNPRNPYAVSKVAAEALCLQWSASEGLDAVIARPFNHIGPGQDERFVVASFARQVAMMRARLQAPTLDVGDVDVTRDFTDVDDVVRAYFALIERGRTGEIYNVASGCEIVVRDLLLRLCRIGGVEVALRQDAARLRPAEQRRMCAAVDRIRDATGWSPSIDLEDTLARTLAYWDARTTA
jgi:GDP-4-dehydro-6-deoxy-D-mannose reductase